MTHRTLTLALAAGVTLAIAGQATAHAHLMSARPAAGGTVTTAPTELDLGFSEGVTLRFTGVTVTGPAAAVPTGAARLGPPGDTALVVPLKGPLAPGLYTVEWHALATDGHKTEGRYTFTISP